VVLGVRNDEVAGLGPALREAVGEPLDSFLDSVEPRSVASTVVDVLGSGAVVTLTATIGAQGCPRYIEIRVARKGDDECLALVRDVTQEREVEARLRVAERLASLGTLAGGVAHEINNPLSYVSANADYVIECLDRIPADELSRRGAEDARQALSELQEGARRIASIVQGLKSQTREDDVTLVPTDPNEAVEAALRILDNQIKYRSRIELALGDVPRVVGRPQHLVQVVVNLVANALDAFPQRPSDRNLVRIATRVQGGAVVLEVRDNGSGIPENVRHRIFDPFFTTKPPNVGTGLGLYLSHQYLSAASATIDVESEEGLGTRFEIRLRPADGLQLPEPSAPASSGRIPTSRILVVDDEPLVARSLSRMLRGHELVLASDGEAALWECLSRDFDLILCDVMMPRLDGVGFHAALAEHRPALARRIVFMTGGTFTPATREFLSQVPNALVEKPIQPGRLFEAARRQLAAAAAGDAGPVARSA
jgi:signal transduction histidine kinase